MPQRAVRMAGTLVVALIMVGCGDAPTGDPRAYTKAPLETIGIFIDSEYRSDVRAFARFNLPDGQPITAPEPADDGST